MADAVADVAEAAVEAPAHVAEPAAESQADVNEGVAESQADVTEGVAESQADVTEAEPAVPADAGIEAPVEAAVDAALAQAAAIAGNEAVAGDAPLAQPRVAVAQPSWAQHESGDIRGVLIQVGGGRLLLPNATIAEVLSYAEPEPVESGADWLLGRFRWRGWQIPLVSFSRLSGIGEDSPGLGSKIVVLKALGGDRRLPFFAVVTQGFPRLVTVSRAALGVEADDAALPAAVQAHVRLNDEPALLPDLLHIEHCLHELRDAA